jgi:phytoene synthase
LQRLALAYAPKEARLPTLALLALDTRLAGIVRNSHEPMLAQLRLAWWREQLSSDPASWPRGEPLLAALRSWQGHEAGLLALVNGWEYLTGTPDLAVPAFEGFATGRGDAFAALAETLASGKDVEPSRVLGRAWALADLAAHLSRPEERQAVRALVGKAERPARLSRKLRPLTVLHGLALRRADDPALSPAALLTVLRLGLLGR